MLSDFLEAEIDLIIFLNIQGFHLGRNSFAGIVTEFPASAFGRYYPFFDAQNLLLIHCGAPLAVAAGGGYLFAKQHNLLLSTTDYLYYTTAFPKMPQLFFDAG